MLRYRRAYIQNPWCAAVAGDIGFMGLMTSLGPDLPTAWSGSYPSETQLATLGEVNPHKKTSSFDSATHPVPAKPARPKPLMRERFRCVDTYPAQGELELELKIGDVIYVHKKRDDGWYKGTLQRSGKTGLFPGSFVEKCESGEP